MHIYMISDPEAIKLNNNNNNNNNKIIIIIIVIRQYVNAMNVGKNEMRRRVDH